MKYYVIAITILLLPAISLAGNINIGTDGLNGLYFHNVKIIDYIHFSPNPYGVWINDSGIYEYSNGYVKMVIVPLSGPVIFMYFNGSGRSVMKFENYVYRDITYPGFQDNDSVICSRGYNVSIYTYKNYANVSWRGQGSLILIIDPEVDFNSNSYLLFTPYNISINIIYKGISLTFPNGGIRLNGTSIVLGKHNPVLLYSNININKYYYRDVGKILVLNETSNGYTAIINFGNYEEYNYIYPVIGILVMVAVSAIMLRTGRK